jgi:transposase-like protein
LADLEGVDGWAAGGDVKAGLADSKAALRGLIGVLTTGQQGGLTVESGQRESKASGGAVLRDLRARGLPPWRCTMADGHLGIWAAQRCWNHRIVHVLDAMPTTQPAPARTLVWAMP